MIQRDHYYVSEPGKLLPVIGIMLHTGSGHHPASVEPHHNRLFYPFFNTLRPDIQKLAVLALYGKIMRHRILIMRHAGENFRAGIPIGNCLFYAFPGRYRLRQMEPLRLCITHAAEYAGPVRNNTAQRPRLCMYLGPAVIQNDLAG